MNRPDTIWRCQVATSGGVGGGGVLTGNGSQVQVVPDHLLEFMVEGALLELQAEVVTQIRVQHLPCREEENFGSVLYRPTDQLLSGSDLLKQGFSIKHASMDTP